MRALPSLRPLGCVVSLLLVACGSESSTPPPDEGVETAAVKKVDAGLPDAGVFVVLYGAAGTFGSLGARTPTGQALSLVALPDWNIHPGQAFFFSNITSDGTLFIGNLPQTANEFIPTACDMVVTCFNPLSPTCAGPNGPTNFANLQIPAAAGNVLAGGATACPMGTVRDGGHSGGPDIGDVWTVTDPSFGERVYFTSDWAALGFSNPNQVFPAFGAITNQGGVWNVDTSLSRSPQQLFESGPAGQSACSHAAGSSIYNCGNFNELQQFPQSRRFLVTQYLALGSAPNSAFAVVDLDGKVLAAYTFPIPANPCGASALTVAPRAVQMDPTSTLGDERFVVAYDVFNDPRGSTVQEFTYNDATATLTPVSAPFFATSAAYPAPTCAGPSANGNPHYDAKGNLWISWLRSSTLSGPISLYPKDPVSKKRSTETLCSNIDPTTGHPRPWGFACPTTVDLGAPGATTYAIPFPGEAVEDSISGAFIYTDASGDITLVQPVTSSSGAVVYASKSPVNLGNSNLPPLGLGETGRFTQRASLDLTHRWLWAPIATSESDCGFLCADNILGANRYNYLARIELDRLLTAGPNVLSSTAPASSGHADIPVAVTTDLAAKDAKKRFAYDVYEKTTRVKTGTHAVSISCAGALCSWQALVPKSKLTANATSVTWHMFVIPKASPTRGTLVTGAIAVHP